MNEPNSTINDAPGILKIDNDVKYDDKKRLSLTLPLLNVEYTMADNEKPIDSNTNSPQMENAVETMQPCNKMKKIYESDDVFIQTIFSQTIKSTTATPSDDEPSQGFDPFKRLPSSPSQDEFKSYECPTDKTDLNEPMFVYFHQTIEEDDPPNDLKDFDEMPPELTNSNPINILTNTNVANGIEKHLSNSNLSNLNESCDVEIDYNSNDTDDDELTESLNQSYSNQSDVQTGDETIVTTTEKVLVEKSGRKKSVDGENLKSKKKSKKSKKSNDLEKENISVRSGFSKFDALQKQNMKNVRTDEGVKLNGSTEGEKLCKSCGKIVYKMEEMKAEKSVWHKNCFRCSQCSKPLSVDTYESHEGVLYCKLHFKSLFSPKAVEDTEPEAPSKPELIIRESQPIELPPDVVRSSDKTDLGLSELQQLNVKERYNMFENGKREESHKFLDRDERIMKRGSTVLSKLAKFKAKGMDIGTAKDSIPVESCDDDDDDKAFDEDCEDIDLLRAKQAIDRDWPVCIANMNDIKSKFESGHSQSREERREERKQEIQNIRSRLFMGKQAKIKEMYQQAIAESEQCVRASDKKPDVDIGDKARSIMSKFENGEVFKEETNHSHPVDDSAVFEHGLGKQSRSIFMEIDAKVSASPQTPASPTTPKRVNQMNPVWPPEPKEKINIDDVIKYDEKVDEVKIKTADISSKFKFFETFKPQEQDKKPFRITPPREGLINANQNDDETNELDNQQTEHIYSDASIKSAQRSSTTTKMLSVFRQMEENERVHRSDDGPKPLKSFTPPPDDSRHLIHRNSESESEYTDSEEDDDESEGGQSEDENDNHVRDESLQQAQAAARAKHLRAKFEKWEQKEIQREQDQFRLYDGEDQSQIESTQSIRAKFESLKNTPQSPSREKIEVHRFV